MSLPSGPKIFVRVSTSNFSAAATSTSAACCGVSNFSAKELLEVAAATAWCTEYCAGASTMKKDKLAHVTKMQVTSKRLMLAEVDLILFAPATPYAAIQLPASPTTSAASTTTTEASAAARSHAGRATTAAAARTRSVVA